jgi:hypothetical protein
MNLFYIFMCIQIDSQLLILHILFGLKELIWLI